MIMLFGNRVEDLLQSGGVLPQLFNAKRAETLLADYMQPAAECDGEALLFVL